MDTTKIDVKPFERGRPSIYKINFRAMKIGDIVYMPMDTTNKRFIVCRRHSYSQSAKRYGMKVSTSIITKPGCMSVKRVK